jgi:hypothetical protein
MKRHDAYFPLQEWCGHRGVILCLYHASGLPESVYQACALPGIDPGDPKFRAWLDDTFSEEELEVLKPWIAVTFSGVTLGTSPSGPFDESRNYSWATAPSSSSSRGHLDLSEFDGWPLPYRVKGFYDLSTADSGPYVYDESRAVEELLEQWNEKGKGE